MTKEDFIKELKNLLLNEECQTKNYGKAVVADIIDFTIGQFGTRDVKVLLKTEIKEVSYFLFTAFSNKAIIFNDDITRKLSELKIKSDSVIKAISDAELKAEKEKLRAEEKKQQELLAAEKAKKAEIAKQAKIKKLRKEAQNLKYHHIVLTNDFYTTLGFVAKHVGSISAAVPDFLEGWFKSIFPDQHYVYYDSNAKTSGGYSMKWGLSLTASLKDVADGIPGGLAKYVNSEETKITNTQFVFDLVDKFGFKFGKEQDINSILDTIPADKLDCFKEGFEA